MSKCRMSNRAALPPSPTALISCPASWHPRSLASSTHPGTLSRTRCCILRLSFMQSFIFIRPTVRECNKGKKKQQWNQLSMQFHAIWGGEERTRGGGKCKDISVGGGGVWQEELKCLPRYAHRRSDVHSAVKLCNCGGNSPILS